MEGRGGGWGELGKIGSAWIGEEEMRTEVGKANGWVAEMAGSYEMESRQPVPCSLNPKDFGKIIETMVISLAIAQISQDN